ncbi:hypothetical protein DFQ27_008123 [Actinomortierella ambigua]|uniref:Uncharacterized protein n=1 Tax=Actinomortierella ambigua TaxID=1343610 RepID=A0A9P6UBR3_9FUNG|nr:hypothetical protein DFQ27_008123 [Actinomortierella ambigua]
MSLQPGPLQPYGEATPSPPPRTTNSKPVDDCESNPVPPLCRTDQHSPPSSERHLLKLRLVSRDLGNLVALSPSFWHEIHFNRRTYLRPLSLSSSSSSSSSSPLRLVMRPSHDHSTAPPPRSFHGIDSDANIVQAHPQSWVSAVSQQPSERKAHLDGTEGPISSIVPKSLDVLWHERTTSFIQFMRHLASIPETAEGVHQVIVEDIADETLVQALWKVLVGMPDLKEFSLKWSFGFVSLLGQVLLPMGESSNEGATPHQQQQFHGMAPPWRHLTRLDLTGSVLLRDIRGIRDVMPALTEVVLEGCHGIDDFRPLVRVGYFANGFSQHQPSKVFEENGLPQRSNLQTLVLSQTKLDDSDLIELVTFSPNLRELRLEQCYKLTIVSLIALGVRLTTSTSTTTTTAPPSTIPSPPPLPHLHPSGQASGPPATPPCDQHNNSTLTTTTTTTTTNPNVPAVSICPNLRVLSLKGCWDLDDYGVRALIGCPHLEMLNIRGLRRVREETIDWLHNQGVPLRKALGPLGHWRHFQA